MVYVVESFVWVCVSARLCVFSILQKKAKKKEACDSLLQRRFPWRCGGEWAPLVQSFIFVWLFIRPPFFLCFFYMCFSLMAVEYLFFYSFWLLRWLLLLLPCAGESVCLCRGRWKRDVQCSRSLSFCKAPFFGLSNAKEKGGRGRREGLGWRRQRRCVVETRYRRKCAPTTTTDNKKQRRLICAVASHVSCRSRHL
jgi:hypothetical protein